MTGYIIRMGAWLWRTKIDRQSRNVCYNLGSADLAGSQFSLSGEFPISPLPLPNFFPTTLFRIAPAEELASHPRGFLRL
jgi:hypothetical protein